MAAHLLGAVVVFRVLLPILLAICVGMRFSVTSLFHLILLLVNPLLKGPSELSMKGHTGWYLKAVAVVGVFNFVMSLVFQIVLLSMPPYASFLQPCSANETILRHIGLVRLDDITEEDGTRWVLPECLLLVLGPAAYIACSKLVQTHEALRPAITDLTINPPPPPQLLPYRVVLLKLMNSIGTPLSVFLIGLAGVLQPSLISSVYFAVFMVVATYWSLNNSLGGRRFGYVCRGLTVLSGVHILLLYLYQAQWVQESIPQDSVTPRVFGMQALYVTRCAGDPRAAYVPRPEWHRFVNPVVLVCMYYLLHYHSRFLLSNKASLLLRQSGAPGPSVRSLIRRHTVMRRSTKRSSSIKSRKRNASSSTTGGPPSGSILPFKSSPFTFGSFSSSHVHGHLHDPHRRKSSAISARSVPIPKSPQSSSLAQRRKSAFPDFGLFGMARHAAHHSQHHQHHPLHPHHLHPHHHHQQPHHQQHVSTSPRQSSLAATPPQPPHFSTIHRVPHHHNPFSHLPPPRHRRSASTAIRQHLLPPLDRPPAPVPPEADLQLNEIGVLLNGGSLLSSVVGGGSGIGGRSPVAGTLMALSRGAAEPQPLDASLLEPRPHSDKDGAVAWSPTPSLHRQAPRSSLQVPGAAGTDGDADSGAGGRRSPSSGGTQSPRFQDGDRDDPDYEDDDDFENPLQRIIAPLVSACQLLVRSSYIATNIVMMAWSITYHSWLTFVLLMWACVLWMIPNQRAAMLRCSPFLVVYAELLLVLQYIYSLDLTDEELPSQVERVNLGQIGLVKARILPANPLIVKILYTSMFWLTLRQYVQEVLADGSPDPVSQAAAMQPFTVAVTTTSTGQPVTPFTPTEASQIASCTPDQASTGISRFGKSLRTFLVKFWIWLVAINLFVFGIQGSEVVIFRIMYMVFFLIFTIVFQVSYSAWRRFLYGFWLTVITYQMLVLVLTYTYQFDNFPEYWHNYTGMPVQLQNDIGLEVYDTGRLFIKLMTPTFFVIVTIIQVHYFHKDFLELSDIEEKVQDTSKVPEKKVQPPQPKPTVTCPKLLDSCTLEDIKGLVLYIWQHSTWHIHTWTSELSELGWRFLEIHIMKIVLGSVMLLACYDVCAFHWVFILLVTIAVPCSPRVQTLLCRACVTITALLLIIRMIYQIDYIDEQGIARNCSMNETWNPWPHDKPANTALWLGLSKAKNLSQYLKGYIGIIVVITVQAVVGIRQQYVRQLTGAPPPPPGVLFNNVTRDSADEGLPNCVKFLFNYGFYKFGVEICLMSLVGVIGTRLDLYSLFYAGWLVWFYNRERRDMARVWHYFVISTAAIIPLQYLMSVGMPPTSCLDYPWAWIMNKELREWLFFPDFVKPPESYKIVTDFCLLVFAVSQQNVFNIEFDNDAEFYDGGSNKEIVYLDPSTLYNPIPDFVTYTKTVLDVLKVVVFFSSYWLTLAVMFLAGTNRITLFAMGYVLGAFIFLWQGNEFYLHPIDKIMKLWNYLLGYNVVVIVIKTFLQLLGCVFLDSLANNACWFVQLFGIACVKKFWDKSDDEIAAKLSDQCAIPKSEAGLMWDGLCFGFLLMQRRLFASFYFQHLVTEMRAQTELASRGAELIAELMQKEIAEQQAAEQAVIAKIKEKMERIKASAQKKEEGQNVQSHYEANTSEQFSNASSPLPTELTSPHPHGRVGSMAGDASPRGGHYLSTTPAAPTPSSANMTLSLDGYMEPTRLSITTPCLPLMQPITSPSDDSFPVFSPPPYPGAPRDRTVATGRGPMPYDIGPPWLRDGAHRRYSAPSISPSMSHHASTLVGHIDAHEWRPTWQQRLLPDYATYHSCTQPSKEVPLTDMESLRASHVLDEAYEVYHKRRKEHYHDNVDLSLLDSKNFVSTTWKWSSPRSSDQSSLPINLSLNERSVTVDSFSVCCSDTLDDSDIKYIDDSPPFTPRQCFEEDQSDVYRYYELKNEETPEFLSLPVEQQKLKPDQSKKKTFLTIPPPRFGHRASLESADNSPRDHHLSVSGSTSPRAVCKRHSSPLPGYDRNQLEFSPRSGFASLGSSQTYPEMYKSRSPAPRTSKGAIRSGDYHMFEEYDDADLLVPLTQKQEDPRQESDDTTPGFTVSDLLRSARKTDIEQAAEEARLARLSEFDAFSSRRSSSIFRRPVRRTLSGRSQYSQASRTSRTTSRSVRIQPRARSSPAPSKPPLDGPEERDSSRQVEPRLPAPTSFPLSAHALPSGGGGREDGEGGRFDGGYEDSVAHDYSGIEPRDPQGLAPLLRRLLHYLNFAYEFVESAMISCTIKLNKFSKDYRYVAACLSAEKQLLKETDSFKTQVPSTHTTSLDTDWPELTTLSQAGDSVGLTSLKIHDDKNGSRVIDSRASNGHVPGSRASNGPGSRASVGPLQASRASNGPVADSRLSGALVVPRSDTVLSMPLSECMVRPRASSGAVGAEFLEVRVEATSDSSRGGRGDGDVGEKGGSERSAGDGSGSDDKTELDCVDFVALPADEEKQDPRPEQSPPVLFAIAIWYAIISRSELVSYVMIFVNQIKSASILSLPLPFLVFLWGSLSVPRPSKNFWIVVIAYTEMIVMVKYFFQFDFFPWNQEERLNQPFWPPRIMGVEKKDKYAIYDLALLLVIFFHRFMLKSLGLWKSSGDAPSTRGSSFVSENGCRQSLLMEDRFDERLEERYDEKSSTSSRSSCPSSPSLAPASSKKQDDDASSTSGESSIVSQIHDGTKKTRPERASTLSRESSMMSTIQGSILSQRMDSSETLKECTPLSYPRDTSMLLETAELFHSWEESPNEDSDEEKTTVQRQQDSMQFEPPVSREHKLLANFSSSSIQNTSSGSVPLPFNGWQSSCDTTAQERPLSELSKLSFYRSLEEEGVIEDGQLGSRKASGASHGVVVGPTSRQPSLVINPHHRRQLSGGSRVSFQDEVVKCSSVLESHGGSHGGGSHFNGSHIEERTNSGLSGRELSESVHVTCQYCNMDAFKNIRKPDIEEVRENLRKVPPLAREGFEKSRNALMQFVDDLLHPEYQVSVNVYTYMFICDFFNFFVLIFGFSAFGTQQGDGGVSAYLEENKVPIPFLVMLILQFGLIIIDRALFLRKFIVGKLIFQVALTFGIHIWMFFILPAVTEREFNAKRPPQIWYMVKCLNLLLSAYQIRCGYPTRILGNYFCKGYNFVNDYSFKVFMYVPFLYELRTLMDWIWTDTSMNLGDWIKMEDIFVRIFKLKCERRAEEEYPQGRGEGKRKLIKYGMGGCALFGVIALIWFPLVLFALSSTVGLPNPPLEVSLQITVGAYQPVFSMRAGINSIFQFSQSQWDGFNYHFRKDRTAQTFLSNYDFTDVVVAELSGNSTAIWGISPPAQVRLVEDLLSNATLKTKIEWKIMRHSNSPDVKPESKAEKIVELPVFIDGKRNPVRERFAAILNGSLHLNPVVIPDLFPKFLKVTNKGQANYVHELESKKRGFVDLNFTLVSAGFSKLVSEQEWFEVEEDCSQQYFRWLPRDKECKFLTMYTFNDKSFPEGLSFISGGGIVGMYTTIVLLVSKMLRGHFENVSATIMFDDMPNVDRILQLCLDIYLVRESAELELEEDLFAKLIFLFRSPETLIKWTRPLEEDMDEDEDGDNRLE